MQSYVGYYEDGCFYSNGQIIKIPERKKTVINVLDESVNISIVNRKKTPQERRKSWARIKELCKGVDSNIDEKKELAEARDEKYGCID